ncbi:glycine-rich domain-containing protein [Janthinobacterium agaricidamnosum]|uniref:Uncharacterized protein n=1 Tax=Janthinobacterium agaricidamnosum NBRC 102515 = DSM 9628 TaxID=1349767 RepID=W0V9S7_9BURK|nr:hypothetical protein [Janthinobacterium agaricidamnosum]CDG84646.1 hypothetical protein GJA_4036 [Janthinobacterium agaricidamnosum NBRC 102515 = DSM 9628]
MNDSDQQDDGKFKEFLHTLNQLDFGPLAYKLMHPEDHPGLSFEQTLDAIKKYKGFLFLCHANQEPLSPSRYIDYVWHAHLLDTELYLVQSSMLFGDFLHHFPFFGKRGNSDEADLLAAAEFTRRQALLNFGWDEDGWCGTGPKPHGPGLAALLKIIFPQGVDHAGMQSHPDSFIIQSGNFKHTIEHLGLGHGGLFSPWLSDHDRQARAFKRPIPVISCKPAYYRPLKDVWVLRNIEKLDEIGKELVQNRLTPHGYSNALVELRLSPQKAPAAEQA